MESGIPVQMSPPSTYCRRGDEAGAPSGIWPIWIVQARVSPSVDLSFITESYSGHYVFDPVRFTTPGDWLILGSVPEDSWVVFAGF